MKVSGNSSHTQQQLAVMAGLKQLRISNRWAGCPLTEAQIESPEVESYLLRGLDEDCNADARFEKDIQTSIYLSVKRSKWKPRRIAKLLARQAVEELRAARLTTLYHDKRIDAITYKKESENNYVLNTLAVARSIKKRYVRKSLKTGLAVGLYLAGAPHAAVVAGGSMLTYALLPKKYKEKFKSKTKELARQAVNTVSSGLKQLKEKGRQAAENAQTVLINTFETARHIAEPVMSAAREVADKLKKKAIQTKGHIKSVWNRLFKK